MLALFVFSVKVVTNLKSMDTNRANAPYVFTLLWPFPKLLVALLFVCLLGCNQEVSSQMGSECL